MTDVTPVHDISCYCLSCQESRLSDLSDRQLMVLIYHEVDALRSKMASAEDSISKIVDDVRPTIDRLQSSPLMKMLGG